MKYKRLIIIMSSIFAFVILCVILSFTLFKVNTISFDFENSTKIFASQEKQNEVIASAGINKSMPIFSLNKAKIAQNLEAKNPYLKVINIESVFPNKLVIHCAEREETFCIKSRDDMYYVCDDELKILNISTSIVTAQSNPVLLSGVSVINTGATFGEFLELGDGNEVIKSISNAFAYSNKTIADIKSICKSIELLYENNPYVGKMSPTLAIVTYDDFKIYLRNANSFLINKVNIMLNFVPECSKYYSTHELVIDINPDNVKEVQCYLDKK